MPSPIRLTACLATALLAAATATAAPDRASFAEEPHPVEGIPIEAFDLARDDLQIEVWARSPMIFSPVAMDCDALGRLWVTEGIDYNTGARVEAGQSIIVLEDTDGDGTADSSHVFVTEKGMRPAPLGIAVFDNKIVLSATPSIIVYTDVDRDARFDPEVDSREVFLTGFKNDRHDHSLHAVVGGPAGDWHFSFGNCGANIQTKDGRHFLSGSYYGNADDIGRPSSDGRVWVGGVTMRIRPDGTGLTPTAHNMRNPHDMFVSSFGDLFQSDNDDPAHCRSSWVMEGANFGYADLRDGDRSWEEVAKSWEEPKDYTRDLRFSRSHWRENYPGAFPPGRIYGAGSPTGNVLVEDDTLGLRGTYLVACMVRKEIMSCSVALEGSGYSLGRHQPFVSLKPEEQGRFFLPTDLVLGTDGSLFFSDFYNDTSRRTNQVSGTIYRITKKDGQHARPEVDLTSTPGQVAALASPAVNVRSHAAALLAATQGREQAVASLTSSLAGLDGDPELTARHLWILAQLGPDARDAVLPYLEHEDPALAITAFRALRLVDDAALLDHAAQLATSPHPALRREVAVSLRDVPYDQCRDILAPLFVAYDGIDRVYLEALGIAAAGKEQECYRDFVAPLGDPASWGKTALNLAWRLHTPEAVAALDTWVRAQRPPVDDFRHAAMAFAVFRDEVERADRIRRLTDLASLPEFAAEPYQITVREIIDKDLNDLEGTALTVNLPIPERFGPETQVSAPDIIAALPGDAEKGKTVAMRCIMCHRIEGGGIPFGPDLTRWGGSRTIEEIIQEITDPDARLAHGYDKPVRITSGDKVVDGLMTNYSWHAGSLKVRIMTSEVLKILFRQTGARVEERTTSPMPSASEMGLTDQEVRDVAEYLKALATNGPAAPPAPEPSDQSPPDGTAEGWRMLAGEDFINVNCHPDTWRWEGGHAFCSGKPVGVIRYREPLRNFELLCEWMHHEKGGNSGVFVWATPQSIDALSRGQGRLPHGIEVQVLDTGYAEVYTRQYNKPADWFTSHGDVFPVGPVTMRPFPPVAPDGRRSFPSKETTKDRGNWNHYYIRAIDGEIRLWVNGEEVSGGDQIEPAAGYLCLESEGAPVEFRNIRLRILPSEGDEDLIRSLRPKEIQPVSLDGHPLVGTWVYGPHSREITADGWCILRSDGQIQWRRRCVSKTDNGIVLEGNLGHELIGDVLHIEGRYQARRQ